MIPIVKPLDLRCDRNNYDLAICAIGYEERARFVAEHLGIKAETLLALGFLTQQEESYWPNSQWYERAGFKVGHLDDDDFRKAIQTALGDVDDAEKTHRVCVDISSLTRLRLANLLTSFSQTKSKLAVDFYYTLAAFAPPPDKVLVNTHVGPVVPELAGWWTEPERPPVAIVGLGYEENKALGAVEHLQSSEKWLYIPESVEPAYTPALQSANRTLLSAVKPDHQFTYRVDRPFDCFVSLESLVYGIRQFSNPVILPFGPKVFSLCAMLLALVHPEVGVWRVSAQGTDPATNRKSSGNVYGLTALFNHSE